MQGTSLFLQSKAEAETVLTVTPRMRSLRPADLLLNDAFDAEEFGHRRRYAGVVFPLR
jgi:hypothetical protein